MSPVKKIEDDAMVFGAAVHLLETLMPSGMTKDQMIESLFAALTTVAVMNGWSFETLRDWFLKSAETSYNETIEGIAILRGKSPS